MCFPFKMKTGSSANPESNTGPTVRHSRRQRPALNLEKFVFAVSELDILGPCISAAGVTPLQDNVQVSMDFPKPADCNALQRFLV